MVRQRLSTPVSSNSLCTAWCGGPLFSSLVRAAARFSVAAGCLVSVASPLARTTPWLSGVVASAASQRAASRSRPRSYDRCAESYALTCSVPLPLAPSRRIARQFPTPAASPSKPPDGGAIELRACAIAIHAHPHAARCSKSPPSSPFAALAPSRSAILQHFILTRRQHVVLVRYRSFVQAAEDVIDNFGIPACR